jgi:hypothetical protein
LAVQGFSFPRTRSRCGWALALTVAASGRLFDPEVPFGAFVTPGFVALALLAVARVDGALVLVFDAVVFVAVVFDAVVFDADAFVRTAAAF